jgi:molybdate transport repressor ModE-like protein
MNFARDVLTPESLTMLQTIARLGSFAAAAREMGLVPSALSYRVRQMEESLDVLLFDRSSRQAKLTAAGTELLSEGMRLLNDMDSIAHRIKRVATGWESQFTVVVDTIIQQRVVMDLCQHFFEANPPTRLRLRDETLSGTLYALTSGQADLAIGVVLQQDLPSGHTVLWQSLTRCLKAMALPSICWPDRMCSPCPAWPPSSTPNCVV